MFIMSNLFKHSLRYSSPSFLNENDEAKKKGSDGYCVIKLEFDPRSVQRHQVVFIIKKISDTQ